MRKLLPAIMLMAFLFSCSKTPTPEPVQESVVTFRAASLQTRATESSFEKGDSISVFASDDYYGELSENNYSDNSVYVYSSEGFAPASLKHGISYPDEYTSLSFYAVWPYSSSYGGDGFSFEVQSDQSEPDDYAASNLMIARTDATHSDVVDLHFDHLMCKVVININSDNFPTGERLCLFNNVYTESYVDLDDATVETVGEQTMIWGSLNGTNSFKALLPPQTIVSGTQFFVFQIGEKAWQWKPSENLILASGVEYEYDLYI